MTEVNRPLKVFIYHAPADRMAVRDLYLRLIQEGADARVVKEKLLPGQDWKEELQTAFREADVVIICVSGRFNREEFRQKEVRLALDTVVEQVEDETFIVPARLDECDRPENLQKWQCVDLFKKVGYDVLLYTLHRRAEKIGAAIEIRDGLLPQIAADRFDGEHPIPEPKPAEPVAGTPEAIDGAGILIEGTRIRPYRPGRAIILVLLGCAAILLMAVFDPSWTENSQPLTVTPERKTTSTPTPGTQRAAGVDPEVIPIPTLAWKRDFSHIIFLIDTSGSMQGQKIRRVKSAVSRFIARLRGEHSISVIAFNTHVELRAAATRDRAAAIEAIRSIDVDVPHNGACIRDAFYAGYQLASSGQAANDPGAIIFVLTDIVVGENIGWSCAIRFDEYFANLGWVPVPVFSIYLGDQFAQNQFVASMWAEGSVRPAVSERRIESTLLSMSEAAGLELTTESATPVRTTDAGQPSMVFVPPGDSIMGDHTVYLDSFWIDKTEVTNAMYVRCVQAGACSAPRSSRSNTRDPYYGNPRFDDYPVIYVSWEDANRYCSWTGGRLPTEAEWEKAARGTDARPFPWGAEDPSVVVNLLNYRGQDTTEAGSYPLGASPYGALDMAGNVSEWVADWLSDDYYHNPPASDPTGPETGEYRVWRGGSWANTSSDRVRTDSRTGNLPTDASSGIGFRCARDAGP